MVGKKRSREDDATLTKSPNDDAESPIATPTGGQPSGGPGPGGTSSNFRNVSACNRCRHRKNRCDQQLPRCSACAKASTKCVGFDPVSKREIPRSYVYYLETRVRNLEALVTDLGGVVPPQEDDFAIDETIQPGVNVPYPVLEDGEAGKKSVRTNSSHVKVAKTKPVAERVVSAIDPALEVLQDGNGEAVENSTQHAPDARRLSTVAGISFARVVFAAVKSSVSQNASEHGGVKPPKQVLHATDGTNTHRDSFFGLHTRPTVKAAPFPQKSLGIKLVELYFEHANPQIPILHRGEFMTLFDRVYNKPAKERTPRELYMVNIVFAIGSGIIVDSSTSAHGPVSWPDAGSDGSDGGDGSGDMPSKKRSKLNQKCHPEEYHSAAITHLEKFLGSGPALDGHSGGLEELQAVLLLAGLALLRPYVPLPLPITTISSQPLMPRQG
jgi:hypothetical protein